MAASRIKMGPFKAYDNKGRAVVFKPVGDIFEVGDASTWYTRNYRQNPFKKTPVSETQGGRIIVGFNVGIEEKFDMDYIIDLVFKLRRKQVESAIKDGEAQPHPLGGDVGITFLAQKGIWQAVRDEQAYPENGAQITIMNIIQENKDRFETDMIHIAETMVEKMSQNTVLIEMSKSGVITDLIEVRP